MLVDGFLDAILAALLRRWGFPRGGEVSQLPCHGQSMQVGRAPIVRVCIIVLGGE